MNISDDLLELIEICENVSDANITELAETPGYMLAFGYLTFTFCSIYFPVCFGIFYYYRSKDDAIYQNLKKRNASCIHKDTLGQTHPLNPLINKFYNG